MGYASVTLLGHFSYDFTIMCYENLDLKLLFFHLLLYGVAVFVFKGLELELLSIWKNQTSAWRIFC